MLWFIGVVLCKVYMSTTEEEAGLQQCGGTTAEAGLASNTTANRWLHKALTYCSVDYGGESED